MATHHLIPGLTLRTDMYDAAVAALAQHAPAYTLDRDRFFAASSWTLVPDPDGVGYKAELTLRLDGQPDMVRFNRWMRPDLRGGQQPRPHSHPWWFRSYVLDGGYSEVRREVVDGQIQTAAGSYRSGQANEMPLHVFHEVVEIDDPAAALSMMVIGPGRQPWGYLDLDTGEFERATLDPGFMARQNAINPQHRR